MKFDAFMKRILICVMAMILMVVAIAVCESGQTASNATSVRTGIPDGWMEGIPSVIPPFSGGKLDRDNSSRMATGDNVVYVMYYEAATLDQAREYLDKMKQAGFQIDIDEDKDGNLSFRGKLSQGESRIGFNFSYQDGGHIDYRINLVKASQ